MNKICIITNRNEELTAEILKYYFDRGYIWNLTCSRTLYPVDVYCLYVYGLQKVIIHCNHHKSVFSDITINLGE